MALTALCLCSGSIKCGYADPATTTLNIVVVERISHQPALFTQGFELVGDTLYESSGLYGQSLLMKKTNDTPQFTQLPKHHFAEGLTVLGERLYLLTWRATTAYVLRASDLGFIETKNYTGEGWGLCNDGTALIMSDGSAELRFIEPSTFKEIRRITVRENDKPIKELNELEYAKGLIFANIWHTDDIIAIDPKDGNVVRRFDFSELSATVKKPHVEAVMNGIAYDAASDSFLITGKLWPEVIRVKLSLP